MIVKSSEAKILNVLNKEDEDENAISKEWETVRKEAKKEEKPKAEKN